MSKDFAQLLRRMAGISDAVPDEQAALLIATFLAEGRKLAADYEESIIDEGKIPNSIDILAGQLIPMQLRDPLQGMTPVKMPPWLEVWRQDGGLRHLDDKQFAEWLVMHLTDSLETARRYAGQPLAVDPPAPKKHTARAVHEVIDACERLLGWYVLGSGVDAERGPYTSITPKQLYECLLKLRTAVTDYKNSYDYKRG